MDNMDKTFVVQFSQSDNTYSKLKFKEISDVKSLQIFIDEQKVYKTVFNIEK